MEAGYEHNDIDLNQCFHRDCDSGHRRVDLSAESAGPKDCALGLGLNTPAPCRKAETGGRRKPVSKSARNESSVSTSDRSRQAIVRASWSPGAGSRRGSLTSPEVR